MQGIYIHIPFCKQKCHYCDFHFSTSLKYKNEMLEALLYEIELRKNEFPTSYLNSVYLGGGTPSILEIRELQWLLEKVYSSFAIDTNTEITLEANPDDITPEKVFAWKNAGVNRLSIGIQSFYDEDLLWMNRAHNARQALHCIDIAKNNGFDAISADLIFGYPLLTQQKWEYNINKMLSYELPHLSTYSMTVEPKTALADFIRKKKLPPINDEVAAEQYLYLIERLYAAGYEHYELSNFAKPGKAAIHNSGYWTGMHYIGIGPSAHSFDGETRSYNVANNMQYMLSLQKKIRPAQIEAMTPINRLNERILTGLRLHSGLNKSFLSLLNENQKSLFLKNIKQLIAEQLIVEQNDTYILSLEGKLKADYVSMQLFFD